MEINLSKLANGLRVATVERPQTETVSLGIWVNTGSSCEYKDINGISHFVEHMVFKGTKSRNALQISEDIENVGGQTNAYTSREFTVFYAKMLKNDIELATDVLSELVMSPSFDAQEMAKEKEVVVQEIKQTNDDPRDIVFDYFQSTAFADQALGMSILGPAEKVRSFDADKLREYMHHNYAAENIMVVAVGNLKHDNFVKMVEERMATLNPHTDFVRDPQIYTGGQFIKTRDIEQAQVLLGFKGINYGHPLYYPTSILSTLFGGSMSSRLFQEIREKRGLVYSVYSFTNTYMQNGLFGIYAGLNQEEIKNYVPVVADEVKKIVNDYVTDKELNRVKVQLKASILMALESSSST
ncbi:MAG: pitrilysin family protein, partial [Alphaproteobacteria bacterium]